MDGFTKQEDDLVHRYLSLKRLAERIVSDDHRRSWNPAEVIAVTQTLIVAEALQHRESTSLVSREGREAYRDALAQF